MSEETWKELKEIRERSGKTWNRFLLELISKKYVQKL